MVLHITSFDWSKINDGKWHHYAVTYSNGIHEVWIDGTKEVSNDFGSFPLWTRDDQPWVFGGRERGEGGGEHYPGELDDVRIYNYALSDAEITALYNEGE
jgi:MSHA biogenesis protein MshQ